MFLIIWEEDDVKGNVFDMERQCCLHKCSRYCYVRGCTAHDQDNAGTKRYHGLAPLENDSHLSFLSGTPILQYGTNPSDATSFLLVHNIQLRS